MSTPSLLFAIPAFNEAGTIGPFVHQLVKHGQVLVVDDGSHDNTAILAEEAGATVHRHATNFGYDNAIATCLSLGKQFSCDWLLTIDADGQHQIEDVEKFKPHFNDTDLIIGIRPLASMRLGERLLASYYQIKHGIHDPLSGFKAYRHEMLSKIVFPPLNPTPSYGLDVLDAVLKINARVAEEPISIRKRQDAARIGNCWKVNKRMLHNLYTRLRHELR
jgi:glycosyltransferase involved in cell wall biosynthesis